MNYGIMGNAARKHAYHEIEEMCQNYGDIGINYEDIFNDKFRK